MSIKTYLGLLYKVWTTLTEKGMNFDSITVLCEVYFNLTCNVPAEALCTSTISNPSLFNKIKLICMYES